MPAEIEKLADRLEAEGWKKQKAGIFYINGTLAINLFKDGGVLSVQQEFYAEEEFVEEQWPMECL